MQILRGSVSAIPAIAERPGKRLPEESNLTGLHAQVIL